MKTKNGTVKMTLKDLTIDVNSKEKALNKFSKWLDKLPTQKNIFIYCATMICKESNTK